MVGKRDYKMKYRIQTGDLKITEREKKLINKILDSNMITEGKYCKKFEEQYAKFIGTKYATITNSGTSALVIGINAMNHLKDNKGKIATTPFTYMATVNSIYLTNNTPIFVDIEEETMGMTPDALKTA